MAKQKQKYKLSGLGSNYRRAVVLLSFTFILGKPLLCGPQVPNVG